MAVDEGNRYKMVQRVKSFGQMSLYARLNPPYGCYRLAPWSEAEYSLRIKGEAGSCIFSLLSPTLG